MGAESLTLLTGKFLLEEKKENPKREGRKLKMEGGGSKYKMQRGPFFFFFFLAFLFSKPLKFVLGVPKCEFSTGKKHLMLGKNDFAPLKNIPLMLLAKFIKSKHFQKRNDPRKVTSISDFCKTEKFFCEKKSTNFDISASREGYRLHIQNTFQFFLKTTRPN